METRIMHKYNIKRVHIVNLLCIFFISAVMSVLAVSSLGVAGAVSTFVKAAAACIGMAIIFFIPLNDNVKAVVLCIAPSITAALSFLTDGPFLLGNHYLIFISIAMVTLYFKQKH